MTEKTKPARTVLNQKQAFALNNWLKAFPFAERKPSDLQALAEEAVAALGFPLTGNNLRSAMKVVGVELSAPPKPATPLQVLARYLMVVCEDAGVAVEADLLKVAGVDAPAAVEGAHPDATLGTATGPTDDASTTTQETIF